MPRTPIVLAVSTAILVCLVVVGRLAGTTAQEATPAAGSLPGVTIEALGSGMPMRAPGDALSLLRVTLEPGASIPPHTQPGALVVYVESGTLGFTITRGAGQLTRGAADGTPGAAEPLAAGTEVILNPGDAVFHDEDAGHAGRNPGGEPTVLLLATLLDADQPAFIFTEAATPPPPGATPGVT